VTISTNQCTPSSWRPYDKQMRVGTYTHAAETSKHDATASHAPQFCCRLQRNRRHGLQTHTVMLHL